MKIILGVFVVLGLVVLIVMNYSMIFYTHVEGPVLGVERVTGPSAIITGGIGTTTPTVTDKIIFSFSVKMRDQKSGEIFISSSEDRKWASVNVGECAEARFYPYPPWDLEKRGTFQLARLIKIFDCK